MKIFEKKSMNLSLWMFQHFWDILYFCLYYYFFCYALYRVHLSINDRIYQLTCVHQSTIETWRWGLARQRRRRLSTRAKRSKAKSPTIFMICKVANYANRTLVTVPFLSLQGFCSHCCPSLVQWLSPLFTRPRNLTFINYPSWKNRCRLSCRVTIPFSIF